VPDEAMKNRRRSRLAPGLPVLLVLAALASACGQPAQGPSSPQPSSPAARTTSPASAPAVSASPAPTPSPQFGLKSVAQGLSQPVYLAAPPGDRHRVFIVEKGGTIRIMKDGALLPTPFLDLTGKVSTATEQGLLSMAFDPAHATNRRIYVDYTDVAGDTVVARYTASESEPDRIDPATRTVILKVDQPYANHNGGQLQFGPDGRLYVGLGDGGSEGDPHDYGQDPRVRLAKILGIDVGGSPPRVVTYAYGLRNPWRFSFDPASGDLWIGDVGQDRWEEIDFLKADTLPGANFGWSYFEGDHVYKRQPIDRTRLEFPVFEYPHTQGCSVTGGYVYRGGAIPALTGYYLFADFCSGRVWMMMGPGGTVAEASVSRKVTQISSFGCDASGELYLVSLSGSVYELVP
jgi:glucose/arabinose dehydrogenase